MFLTCVPRIPRFSVADLLGWLRHFVRESSVPPHGWFVFSGSLHFVNLFSPEGAIYFVVTHTRHENAWTSEKTQARCLQSARKNSEVSSLARGKGPLNTAARSLPFGGRGCVCPHFGMQPPQPTGPDPHPPTTPNPLPTGLAPHLLGQTHLTPTGPYPPTPWARPKRATIRVPTRNFLFCAVSLW